MEHLFGRRGAKIPISPSDFTLDIPSLDFLALKTYPPALLPPSSFGISPQPPSDHLQRWSGESGSRGNTSCKASHQIQRSMGGASSHRLGHHSREEVFAHPHPHFLEAVSSATFPCAPISLSTLRPPQRCQVKEAGVGLLDGVQRLMGPSQGCTLVEGRAGVGMSKILLMLPQVAPQSSSYLDPGQQARVR